MEGVFLHNYSETYIFAMLNQRQCSFGFVSTLCFCWVKVSETTGRPVLFFFCCFFFCCCFFPQSKGLMVPTRLNYINEKSWFILNMRKYKFHSNYAVKHSPFTDGEQQTYRTGGEQTHRTDGKQQANRTGEEQRTQQSGGEQQPHLTGGKQQTHRHYSFVFHHVRFNDVS